jgi:uncharacterized protein (DUF1697 family)
MLHPVEHFVFLRAINVGRHNRVRMDDPRGWLAATGFPGARTLLQTGNLLLEADAGAEEVAGRIEALFATRGMTGVSVMVRAAGELVELVALESSMAGVEQHLTPYRRDIASGLRTRRREAGLDVVWPTRLPGYGRPDTA